MARDMPTTAYTEVQIDEDSISLTLISESGSDGAVIEDTARFTFDELQSLAGEHSTLSLSRESANALEAGAVQSQMNELLNEAEALVEDGIEVGSVLVDENAPAWSEDDRVEVTEVLTDERADRFVIQGRHEGCIVHPDSQNFTDKSVADANPSYPSDDGVILGRYIGGSQEYAWPASRLVEE